MTLTVSRRGLLAGAGAAATAASLIPIGAAGRRRITLHRVRKGPSATSK